MNKLMLTGFLLLCAIVSAYAQQSGKINIKITDASGKPLPFASVAVRKAADSAVVKGQLSDESGNCEFGNIPSGSYYIHATQLGYAEEKGAVFSFNGTQTLQLKPLQLTAVSRHLKTVDVTAQKPYVERSEGKTILNVESSAASAGNTALDLLRRAPGVSVDKDENLLLKGKQGVTVMLDGKLTYLSNEALAELLKSMPAETISQIEIITSPGAKYDAAGTSGIINIKTKKGQLTGFNGTVNANAGFGRYWFYGTGVSLNWKTTKFNAFATLNYGDRQSYNTRELKRTTHDAIPLQYHQRVYQTNDFMNRSYKSGVDYNITEKQSIGVMVTGYSNAFWRTAPSVTDIARIGGATDSMLHTGIYANNRFGNVSVNLNYKFRIDSSGSEFTMDADYAKFRNRIMNLLDDSVQDVRTGIISNHNGVRTRPQTDMTIKSIKADLVKSFNKKGKIEAGVKASFVTTGNIMHYDSLRQGEYLPVPSQLDQFVYEENILAAYLTYKKTFGKTDLVLGLRLEQTIAEANSISLKSVLKRKYLDYFPNMSVDHKFTDDHKLSLSYNKRINRPGYGQLNPFVFFLDKYTYFQGNPYLLPEYNHNAELSYLFKQKFIASVSYSPITQLFDEYLIYHPATKATISTNKNLGRQDSYSFNLTIPFDVVKWWNTSTNGGIYYNDYKIRDTAGDFSNKQLSWGLNSTNVFTLPKDYKFEISGWYEAPNVYGIWRSKGMWGVSAGLQKQIMKKKATLKLNVQDIFASNRFIGYADFNGVNLAVNNRWQNRTVNLSVSYRFGNTKMDSTERKSGTEESGRAGN